MPHLVHPSLTSKPFSLLDFSYTKEDCEGLCLTDPSILPRSVFVVHIRHALSLEQYNVGHEELKLIQEILN